MPDVMQERRQNQAVRRALMISKGRALDRMLFLSDVLAIRLLSKIAEQLD